MIDSVDAGAKYIRQIKWRLNYANKNWLAIICGQTGSGKSYSALSIAEQIGKVWVVFNPIQFMEVLNNGQIQRGDVIVFDEAGVGMSSRQWQSVQNKLLGSILQTFRNMNCAVIFTTPNLSFVDVQARKLFHSYLETSFLDNRNQLAHLKVYDIQVNSMYDRIYYKHPKLKDENGMIYLLSHLAVKKPSEDMVERYEAQKLAYTQALNRNALAELKGENKMQKINPQDKSGIRQKIAEDIRQNPKAFVRSGRKKGTKSIDVDLIMNTYKVGNQTARQVKRELELELGISKTLINMRSSSLS